MADIGQNGILCATLHFRLHIKTLSCNVTVSVERLFNCDFEVTELAISISLYATCNRYLLLHVRTDMIFRILQLT